MSWLVDTGCGFHIYSNRRSRPTVGNETKIVTLAVGNCFINLVFRLILELKDCFYVSNIYRNLIFVASLDKFGYSFLIVDGFIPISLNNIYYGIVSLINGLYIFYLNDKIFSIKNKRTKYLSKYHISVALQTQSYRTKTHFKTSQR